MRPGIGGMVAVVVTIALVGGAAVATAPASAAGPTEALATQSDVEPDTVRLHVTVRPDGTAEWAVEYRIDLSEEDREDAFESLQADVESNPEPFVTDFVDVLSPSVDRAEAETGRSMKVRNVTVSTRRESLARPTGIVTYRFEWTGFAAPGEDRFVVGDAMSGFYVDEDTTLRFEWPDRYEVDSVSPAPDERSDAAAVWHGPADFGSDEPRVVLQDAGPELPLSLAAVAAVLLVATLGIAGRIRGGSPEDADGRPDGGDAQTAAGTEADDSPPLELLSNEERVVAVLEDNGGRMKQQAIAEELEWGAPKTSRVVNDLRDDESVKVFRIGRENVVTLPEEELL